MSEKAEPQKDPNPVIQSTIEAARRVYKELPKGGAKRIGSSLTLLMRDDPEALNRLRAWADPLGFPVEIQEPEPPGRHRYPYPGAVYVEVRKP